MEENNQKPSLRFKGFTEAWEQRKLNELTNIITKGTTPLDKVNEGTINFIKIENIDSFSGNINITSKITEEEHNSYLKRSQLKENDLLFSIAGTLGRVTVVKSDILPANTNQALAIIRLKDGDINYIKTYLKGKTISNFIKRNPTIGAQPNLSLEQVGNFDIDMPNKEEQQKLGNLFNSIDNLITLHQRKCDKLVNVKKALLEKMFPNNGKNVPELRFKGFTEAWEQRKLNEFCEYTTSNLTAEDIDENGKFVLYDANGRIGRTNKNVQKEKYITIIKDGSGVGRTRLTPQNSAFIGTMGALHNKNSDINFLYCCLQNTNFSKEITGATIPHIYFSNYGENNYMVPKIKEQQRIGNIFKELDNLITLHQQE